MDYEPEVPRTPSRSNPQREHGHRAHQNATWAESFSTPVSISHSICETVALVTSPSLPRGASPPNSELTHIPPTLIPPFRSYSERIHTRSTADSVDSVRRAELESTAEGRATANPKPGEVKVKDIF
ncbi:unnamed protein product [Lota lota]